MSYFYQPFIPYGISETPNGNIQYQNFFMPNGVQMQQVMLPYRPFPSLSVGSTPPMLSQTPAPVMQPALGAAEMLWRPPTVAVTNADNNFTAANRYYYHHRPNEQHISKSSRGNVETDAYKEMKRAKQPQYSQGSVGRRKSRSGGVPSENGSNNDYGRVEIERMVNRHHRGNSEHTEMQQAEAVVHQYFEESLNLAHQQRLQAHYRKRTVPKSNSESSATTSSNGPITNSTTYDSSPSTPPPVLMPATYTEMSSGIRTHHYNLKKAWLQRYVWEEYLKEAGVNIDQNLSHSISQMDDIPPVLQCEVIKKRKMYKSSSDVNTELTSPPVILPSTSSTLYEPSTSSGTGTKRCRKRKISKNATSSETRITTDNARPSETEKKVSVYG